MIKCSIDSNSIKYKWVNNIKAKGIKMFVNNMRGALNGGSNRK